MFLDLSVVKQHLRVDHQEEDELIEEMMQSAESRCEAYLNRDIFVSEEALNDAVSSGKILRYPMVITPYHKQAMMLLVGDFYYQRESAKEATQHLPNAVLSLLWADRIRGA